MGCEAFSQKTITIVQGQTGQVQVQLWDPEQKQPFSLVGLTGATGVFPDSDGVTGLAVSGNLVSQDLGTLVFPYDEAFSNALNVGQQQTVMVMVDQGANRTIALMEAVLNVLASPFQTINPAP